MTNQVKIKGKRIVPTYTILRAVSWYSNKLAKTDTDARLNHIVTSILFDAFTFEAYLNHIGALRFSFWPPRKKKLSPIEKLEVICEDLDFHPDLGSGPWQTLGFIFKLRNLLVHAQTETIPFEGFIKGEEILIENWPKAKWEELISVEKSQQFLDDTKLMIMELADNVGIPPEDVFIKDSMEASIITGDDLEGIQE
jgi:hypothetical protein